MDLIGAQLEKRLKVINKDINGKAISLKREVLLKTIVRRVESTVETDNSGSVEVKYIVGKKLEAD